MTTILLTVLSYWPPSQDLQIPRSCLRNDNSFLYSTPKAIAEAATVKIEAVDPKGCCCCYCYILHYYTIAEQCAKIDLLASVACSLCEVQPPPLLSAGGLQWPQRRLLTAAEKVKKRDQKASCIVYVTHKYLAIATQTFAVVRRA